MKIIIQNSSICGLIACYFSGLPINQRIRLLLLSFLIVVTSFAEILSIGAVLPFLGILTDPVKFYNYPVLKEIIGFMGIDGSNELIVFLTATFIFLAIFAGIMRFALLAYSTDMAFMMGLDLSKKIYTNVLNKNLLFHLNNNSIVIINTLAVKINIVIHSFLMPSLIFISSIFLIISILIFLIYIDPLLALISITFFSIIYSIVIVATKKKVYLNGEIIATQSNKTVKALQEGLGGIRDVILNSLQSHYAQNFIVAEIALRESQKNNHIISQSPRFLVEALAVVMLATLACILALNSSEISAVIPSIGILALGAQRLLPMLQNIYGSVVSIRGSKSSFEEVLELSMDDDASEAEIADEVLFENNFSLSSASYAYRNNLNVLEDVNITISKNSKVGIIGKSGSGKTTFLNILMGLIFPTKGFLSVDGKVINERNVRSWQRKIAHVPQEIFIADLTIAENIAVGIPYDDIDFDLLEESIKKAQLTQLIKDSPFGYKTVVGERGAQLSGGQRQRIGIARALYRKPSIIVFDEATSALDAETEQMLVEQIDILARELTILVVSHKLDTLKNCDAIYEIFGCKLALQT
jgi:ATP-binding cassette subfamily B protein